MADRDCDACNSRATDAFRSHFTRLEARMDHIEGVLNKILDRLPVPTVDKAQGKKRNFGNVISEDNGFDFGTGVDKTPISDTQHPGQKLSMSHITERQHEYTPLDTTQSQIRLLRLHRADRITDPLVANLDIVDLDSDTGNSLFGGSHGYVALSYAWGSQTFEGLIIINGCWFPITKSLEAALRQVRSSRQRTFGKQINCWVDQICINQADLDERGNQVNLMRRIYKKARSVLVWLGEEANNSSLAIDILNTIGEPPKHAPGERPIQYPSFSEADIMRHWSSLRALFKRPWWHRVWIRQEIALHRTVELWCGSKSFQMTTLVPALSMLTHIASFGYTSSVSDSDDESTAVLPWDFHARKLVQLRELTWDGSNWVALAQLLRITRACEATDARDMVFSVLGMADPEIYPLVPDYRLDMKEVLLSTAKAALGQQYGLEMFGACQNPERKYGLPSWIPLLTEKWRAMPFPSPSKFKSSLFGQTPQFLTRAPLPIIQVSGEVVALQGGLVDSIFSICNQFVRNNSHAGDIDSVYDSWKIFTEFASMKLQLSDKDNKIYVESQALEKLGNWIRFITIRTDAPTSTNLFSSGGNTTSNFGGPFAPTSLNPKLARSYLLPSSYASAEPRSNHELHAGIQSYGIGRRIGVTRRGFLVLLPAEAREGDFVALFQGATFPYVLRKSDEQGNHVLVGESFIPSWINQQFGEKGIESLARDDWGVDLNSSIRIC